MRSGSRFIGGYGDAVLGKSNGTEFTITEIPKVTKTVENRFDNSLHKEQNKKALIIFPIIVKFISPKISSHVLHTWLFHN